MINRAQEIMKEQEEIMMKIERELQAQREGEAIKLVTEVREAVQILKCEYLLNGSEDDSRVKDLEAKLVVANNNIEALTKKCKEIGPLKSKATKAEKANKESKKTISDLTKQLKTITKTAATWQSKYDALAKELANLKANNNTNDDSDKELLLQIMAGKDEIIAGLEQKLSDKAYQAANDGYLVDGREISVAAVEDLDNTIQELEEELAKQDKTIEDQNEIIANLKKEIATLKQAASCHETTENNNAVVGNKPKANQKEEIKVEEKAQEIVSDDTFEVNANVKFKSGTKVYESKDHYVLAKENIKELVVVPKSFNVEVKSEDVVKYENLLVSKFNFKTDRQAISPVSVNFESDTHKAVLVRTRAAENLFRFSHKDILAGYIVSKYKVYFWSWDLKHNEPYFLDLGQKAKGRKRCEVCAGDRAPLAKVVEAMKAEYEEKAKAYCESNNVEFTSKEQTESAEADVHAKIADILNYEEETQRIKESGEKPESTPVVPESTPETVVEHNNTQVTNSSDNATGSNDDTSKLDTSRFSNGMNDFFNEMF